MNKSESVVNLSKALLKAQKAMGGATKGAANPYFKSRYADYGSVLEACKDPLNDNGIVVLQPHEPRVVDGKNYVETVLMHGETGEFISSLTEIVCAKGNDPQALGSATTYARRFGLESFLALPREDDDGNAASGKTVTSVSNSAKVHTQTVGLATQAQNKSSPAPATPKADVAKATAAAEKVANVTKSEPTAKEAAFAAQKVQAPKAKPPVAKTLSEGW